MHFKLTLALCQNLGKMTDQLALVIDKLPMWLSALRGFVLACAK